MRVIWSPLVPCIQCFMFFIIYSLREKIIYSKLAGYPGFHSDITKKTSCTRIQVSFTWVLCVHFYRVLFSGSRYFFITNMVNKKHDVIKWRNESIQLEIFLIDVTVSFIGLLSARIETTILVTMHVHLLTLCYTMAICTPIRHCQTSPEKVPPAQWISYWNRVTLKHAGKYRMTDAREGKFLWTAKTLSELREIAFNRW